MGGTLPFWQCFAILGHFRPILSKLIFVCFDRGLYIDAYQVSSTSINYIIFQVYIDQLMSTCINLPSKPNLHHRPLYNQSRFTYPTGHGCHSPPSDNHQTAENLLCSDFFTDLLHSFSTLAWLVGQTSGT